MCCSQRVISVITNESTNGTIGVDQYLISSEIYEHIFMENIKKIYKSAGRFDYKQQYKAIIEATPASTPEGFTENSPMPPGPYVIIKNSSARNQPVNFLQYWMSKKNCSSQNGSF